MSNLIYNPAVHELSITESILSTSIKYAEEQKARLVTDIYLIIGDLSSIVDESIQFYWDMVSIGTICEKARLHFNHIKAEIECQNCNKRYLLEHDLEPCPHCSSMNIKIISGDEFQMESIEIEKEP